VLHCGGAPYWAEFDLGDPDRLIVYPSHRRRKIWRARWGDLTRVSFCYFEPPTDTLAAIIESQSGGPT
jgi:hypothetical protein